MSASPVRTPVKRQSQSAKRSKASNESLNHLLNFSFPPRASEQPQHIPRRSRKTGTTQGVWNKEKFVNANVRFVMKPGDYTVHFADPDIFFQWHDILQVILSRNSALAAAGKNAAEGTTTCPICLSPPVAPRMTKCGHVFCFPCILHYLHTSNHLKWHRCPICFDSVNESHLKPVRWFDGPGTDLSNLVDNLSSGSTLEMRLMLRPQLTTLALPRSSTWPSDILPPHQAPFYFLPDVLTFSRFMVATPAYLVGCLTSELDELTAGRDELNQSNDEIGLIFANQAIEKVTNQVEEAMLMETEEIAEAVLKAEREVAEAEEREAERIRRAEAAGPSVPEQGPLPEVLLATQNASRGPKQRRNVNPPPPSTSQYLYYQAATGAPIFLHPLDIRILLAYYGSYAAFPPTLTIPVTHSAESTVTDDLRKRCKYLSHMPEGADVVFVEADLRGIVGDEGMRAFEGLVKARNSRRKEKGKKEDRERGRAEAREREKEKLLGWEESAFEVRLSAFRSYSPPSDHGEDEATPEPPQSVPVPVVGAWGSRTFASTLGSPPTAPRPRPSSRQQEEDDQVDVAWHALETRANQSGGGRKKSKPKLVLLGGGPGRRK